MVSIAEYQRLENDNARLKAEVRELGILNDLAIAATSFIEIDDMLDMIVERSVEALQAEQGAIKLLTDEEASPLQTLIQIDQHTQLVDIHVGMHITGWVIRNEESLLIEDLKSDDRFDITPQEADSIKNLLCVPIFFRGELLGIIMVVNKKSPAPFDLRDQRMLSIIAAQSGQLIHNRYLQQEAVEKERIQQELELARQIQLNLIPKTVPQVQNLEVAGYIQAADEVGGDYFDYLNGVTNEITVIVGDVSGKGTSAALYMSKVQGIMRSLNDFKLSPRDLFIRANHLLKGDIEKQSFFTALGAYFKSAQKQMVLARAGHSPLFFYEANTATVHSITPKGMGIGLANSQKFASVIEEQQMFYEKGDIFLFITDGITEAQNLRGDEFGDEKVLELLQDINGASAKRIRDQVITAVNHFAGDANQHDDLTVVVVKAI